MIFLRSAGRGYENILGRDFTADRPNQKRVTDKYRTPWLDRADGQSSIKHHKRCQNKRKGRCGVAPPQRQRVSIYLIRLFKNMVLHHLGQGREIDMTMPWPKISSRFLTQNAFTDKNLAHTTKSNYLFYKYIHFYNYELVQLKTHLTPFEKRSQVRNLSLFYVRGFYLLPIIPEALKFSPLEAGYTIKLTQIADEL